MTTWQVHQQWMWDQINGRIRPLMVFFFPIPLDNPEAVDHYNTLKEMNLC